MQLWRSAVRLKVKRFISDGRNLRLTEVIKSYVEFANHQCSS